MNTCPSDSKLFGSSDSKSATERGDYPERAVGRAAVGASWVNSGCFFRGVCGGGWDAKREFTIAKQRHHGNISVSQDGA